MSFNFKKSQLLDTPVAASPANVPIGTGEPVITDDVLSPELGDGTPKFKDGSELKNWLELRGPVEATDILANIIGSSFVVNQEDPGEIVDPLEVIKGGIQRFYPGTTNQERLEIAMEMFNILPNSAKQPEPNQEDIVQAPFEQADITGFVQDVNNRISKIAQADTKKPKRPYNLSKSAQQKSMENVILWGPKEKRIDPFLRQPVSDWSVVERNKGFGLVVDDVWNIDWEAIWRGSVMDKYSRPYRNKEGKWVGGYIQKRFEVDKWIPERSNMQLKPGEKRKPRPPELGVLEARMEAARNSKQIKEPVAISSGKEYRPDSIGPGKGTPFNWQKSEFNKIAGSELKKKSELKEAQLKPLEDPFADKTRTPRGTKWLDPQKEIHPKVTCQMCGSELPAEPPPDGKCHNCNCNYYTNSIREGIQPGVPDPAGIQFNPFSNKPQHVAENMYYDSSKDGFVVLSSKKKRSKEKKEHEEMYESDEFKQLAGPSDELVGNDDISEVEQSALDLAIE